MPELRPARLPQPRRLLPPSLRHRARRSPPPLRIIPGARRRPAACATPPPPLAARRAATRPPPRTGRQLRAWRHLGRRPLPSVENPRPPPHSTVPPALCQPLDPCGTNRTTQGRGARRAGHLARRQTSFKQPLPAAAYARSVRRFSISWRRSRLACCRVTMISSRSASCSCNRARTCSSMVGAMHPI